jgi:hypothetical protein
MATGSVAPIWPVHVMEPGNGGAGTPRIANESPTTGGGEAVASWVGVGLAEDVGGEEPAKVGAAFDDRPGDAESVGDGPLEQATRASTRGAMVAARIRALRQLLQSPTASILLRRDSREPA